MCAALDSQPCLLPQYNANLPQREARIACVCVCVRVRGALFPLLTRCGMHRRRHGSREWIEEYGPSDRDHSRAVRCAGCCARLPPLGSF